MLLAVLSGALTSALGYALWYRVLPQITASVAGVAQLVVPVLAMMGGMVLLDEALTLNFILAFTLVLGGLQRHWVHIKRCCTGGCLSGHGHSRDGIALEVIAVE